jgi:hypothetical protein
MEALLKLFVLGLFFYFIYRFLKSLFTRAMGSQPGAARKKSNNRRHWEPATKALVLLARADGRMQAAERQTIQDFLVRHGMKQSDAEELVKAQRALDEYQLDQWVTPLRAASEDFQEDFLYTVDEIGASKRRISLDEHSMAEDIRFMLTGSFEPGGGQR